MVRPVYSRRFIAGALTLNGGNLVYTVPAGYCAVVRAASFSSTTAAWGASLRVSTLPGPVNTIIAIWTAQAANTATGWTGFCVVNAGDQIIGAYQSQAVGCVISGYLLTLV